MSHLERLLLVTVVVEVTAGDLLGLVWVVSFAVEHVGKRLHELAQEVSRP